MNDSKNSKTISILNVVIGIVLISLSILVVVFSATTFLTLMIILSLSATIIGLTRLLNAFGNKMLKESVRVMKGVSGALVLFFGLWTLITSIIDPAASIEFLIILLASSLLIIGISRFTFGFQATKFPTWFRIVVLITGISSMGLSILIFILPPIGYIYLILMLSVSLLLNGAARVALGIVKV